MWRSLLPALLLVACVGDDPTPVTTPTTTSDGGTGVVSGDGGSSGTAKADTTSFLGMWSTQNSAQVSSPCTEKSLENTDSGPVTFTIATGSNGADLSFADSAAPGCVLLANIDTGGVTASLLPNQTCTFSAKDLDGATINLLYQYLPTTHFSLQSTHTHGSVQINAKFTISGGEYNTEGCTFTEEDALTKQ